MQWEALSGASHSRDFLEVEDDVLAALDAPIDVHSPEAIHAATLIKLMFPAFHAQEQPIHEVTKHGETVDA